MGADAVGDLVGLPRVHRLLPAGHRRADVVRVEDDALLPTVFEDPVWVVGAGVGGEVAAEVV